MIENKIIKARCPNCGKGLDPEDNFETKYIGHCSMDCKNKFKLVLEQRKKDGVCHFCGEPPFIDIDGTKYNLCKKCQNFLQSMIKEIEKLGRDKQKK